VQYNLMYIAPAAGAPPHWLAFTKAIWGRMKTDPLWLAGGLGALLVGWNLLRTKRVAPLPALASAWGAAAAVAIYANGAWLFNNYFVQALPPLSIMTAWLLSGVRRRASVHASAAWAAMVLMAVLLVSRGYAGRITRVARADLDVLRGRSTRTAYLDQFGDYGTGRGYSARANDELKAYIQAHTGPNDRVYVFGINAVEVYFTADRLAAQRFLRVNYFIPGSYPDPAYRLDAVVRDLDSSRPALIVFERLHSNSELGRITDGLQQNPVVVPLLASYRFQTQIEDFAVYGRIK
jgi:hypothetical protein